ncbi:MAG TPA: hypothetical protein VEK08_07150 [Planctomycetota bacterium]|nr:hypothetical protein [Planctomycetota bacterium]
MITQLLGSRLHKKTLDECAAEVVRLSNLKAEHEVNLRSIEKQSLDLRTRRIQGEKIDEKKLKDLREQISEEALEVEAIEIALAAAKQALSEASESEIRRRADEIKAAEDATETIQADMLQKFASAIGPLAAILNTGGMSLPHPAAEPRQFLNILQKFIAGLEHGHMENVVLSFNKHYVKSANTDAAKLFAKLRELQSRPEVSAEDLTAQALQRAGLVSEVKETEKKNVAV